MPHARDYHHPAARSIHCRQAIAKQSAERGILLRPIHRRPARWSTQADRTGDARGTGRAHERLFRGKARGRAGTPGAPSNRDFWTDKFDRNIERDARKIVELEAMGWRVGVVWECEILRQPLGPLLDRIAAFLTDPEGVLKPSDRDHS